VPTKFEFQRGSKNTKNANGKAAGRLFCERARNLLDAEIKKWGHFFQDSYDVTMTENTRGD
jgi:hypothetical protein